MSLVSFTSTPALTEATSAAAMAGVPLTALPSPVVLAHVGSTASVLAALLGVALLYAAGVLRLRTAASGRRAVRPARAVAFVAALAALGVALVSPLETLASTSLPAHMAQHLLLLVVAAPLLVVSSPGLVLSRSLPGRLHRGSRHLRHRLGRVRNHAGGKLLFLAWLLHVLAVWAWHLPGPFRLAVASPPLHALEHLTLLVTGIALWWGLLRVAHHRDAGGAAVLALFTTSVLVGGLGALITFASDPWYPSYLQAGGQPLLEQQVAGLVMWMGGGVVYLATGIGLFVRWLGRIDRRPAGRARPELLALGLLALLVAGCDRGLTDPEPLEGGSVAEGRRAIQEYGCASCHQIGGIPGPNGSVGPPLDGIADRRTIAGHLPHDPESLARWIQDPQEIEPETIMPDLGVTDEDVLDIVSYLYSRGG